MVVDGFDQAPLDSLIRAEPPDPMVLASALADAAAGIEPEHAKRRVFGGF